jgi:hypothetical protein
VRNDLHVTQSSTGWLVIHGDRIVATFATNREAWRHVDRMNGDPISRSEHVAEWLWQRR